MAESPRCQHYEFAHAALRSVAFEHPVQLMALLATANVKDAFASLLAAVEQTCKGRAEPCDFDASQIGVHLRRAAGHACAVVEMPPPRATGEAYYASPVLLTGADPEKVELRYFTLEYRAAPGSQAGTVLGEWHADGQHVNHGVGPEPMLEPFLAAISALLARPV